jgi:acyl carrier protein
MSTDKLKSIFSENLGIPLEQITDDLQFNDSPEWDSVAHMALIAGIEMGYDILMETDDIINMSSFAKAKEIVARYEAL